MAIQPFISRPINLLRSEGLCVFVAACGAFHLEYPHHWVMFACLFLLPDLSLLMYVRGPNVTASIAYNVAHSYVLPVLLGSVAVLYLNGMLERLSLIWLGHIGMDRMLGYGLKYANSFQFTHLQSTQAQDIQAAALAHSE